MYYFEIFQNFYKEKLNYLIVGGVAVNLYGIPRATMDLDIIIDLEDKNVKKMNEILKKLNYEPIYPDIKCFDPKKIDFWIGEKNMRAFSFKNFKEPYKQIDILIELSRNFYKYWKNREIRKIDNIKINLVSIDDLMEIKYASDRVQDKKDVELLHKIKKLVGNG